MNRNGAVILAALAGLLAALAFGAMSATTASAQGPGSQFCEEYPSFPGCEEDPGGGGGGGPGPGGGPGGGEDPGAGAGPTGEVAAGELPFTGYPLTALILLLIILLLLGLAVRTYLAARDRITAHHDSHP